MASLLAPDAPHGVILPALDFIKLKRMEVSVAWNVIMAYTRHDMILLEILEPDYTANADVRYACGIAWPSR